MNAKRWFHTAVFSFIMVSMYAMLFISNSNEAQHAFRRPTSVSTAMEWLKNLVFHNALGMWQFNRVPVYDQPQKQQAYGLSPNLSTCHKAYAKPGFLVYCCPPNPESNENVIDFQFPDPSAPKRIRRPAHQVDKDYIDKYTRALTLMKALPYEDPRNYRRQADMHCIYCAGAYNQKSSNVELSVHRSWLFFPWHRMLLHFHERILGNLIGDDRFSLPFWNWDVPEGMVLPDLYYKEPFVDYERSAAHTRPQKIADLSYNFVDNNKSADEQISANLAFMYHQMVSGGKKAQLFMGCPYKQGKEGFCEGAGTMEVAPHNTVHFWVGKESNRYQENMGVFYAAARDPVFWAHHSNVDRLWEVWKDLRGYEPEIIDADWLDTYFYFHNEDSQLVRIKIRDVLNITNLGYSFQDVDRPWLYARPKPSIDPSLARHILHSRNTPHLTVQLSDFRPNGRLLETNIVVKVLRPNRIGRTEKGKDLEVVLVVYGIDVKEDVFVKFDVYVNAIDATSIGPESREFAGTFVSLPRGVMMVMNEGDEKMGSKAILKLGISELLQELQADEDDFLWVTLVPRGGTGVSTMVDGIRIEYME